MNNFQFSFSVTHLTAAMAIILQWFNLNAFAENPLIISSPGSSVCGIADVNADGAGDFLQANSTTNSVAILSGRNGELIRTINAPDGATATGFGYGLSDIPDVTGDGVADLLIGERLATVNSIQCGRAHLYSGANGQIIRTFETPNPNAMGLFGGRMASVPDADSDGKRDVMISAYTETVGGLSQAGRVYIYSSSSGNLIHELSASIPATKAQFGYGISNVPDLNGDTIEDFAIVNASTLTSGGISALYLYSGATRTLLQRTDLPPTNQAGTTISVDGLNDLNGDGAGDILVGSPQSDGYSIDFLKSGGAMYVVSGATGEILRTHRGAQANANLGQSITRLPDWNSDGIAEYATRTRAVIPGSDPDGNVLIYSGREGSVLGRIKSPNTTSLVSAGIDCVPDADGDGIEELVIGTSTQLFVYYRHTTLEIPMSIEDDFDDPAFSDAHLVRSAGDTISGSRLTVTNDTYLKSTLVAPFWMELKGYRYESCPAFGMSSFRLVAGNGADTLAGVSASLGQLSEHNSGGIGTGTASLEWYNPQSTFSASSLPSSARDLVVYGHQNGIYVFDEQRMLFNAGILPAGSDVQVHLACQNGGQVSIDKLVLYTEIENRAIHSISPGSNGPIILGKTGVTGTIINNSSNQSLFRAQRIDSPAPGLDVARVPCHWLVSGMNGISSFSAVLKFEYEDDWLTSLGADVTQLALYHSGDNGVSWQKIPSTVNAAEKTITSGEITAFSMWTIGLEASSTVNDWDKR